MASISDSSNTFNFIYWTNLVLYPEAIFKKTNNTQMMISRGIILDQYTKWKNEVQELWKFWKECVDTSWQGMNEERYKSQIFFINSSFINFYLLSWVTALISCLCDFLSKMINFISVKRAVHGTSTGIIQLLSWICRVTIELLPMTLALLGQRAICVTK